MKKGIHPDYKKSVITCTTCGKTYTITSTETEFKVELCANCHPFYTGKDDVVVDTDNRIDKFNKKQTLADKIGDKVLSKREKRKVRKQKAMKKRKSQPSTLKDMLKNLD